jgi:hypothetical protein
MKCIDYIFNYKEENEDEDDSLARSEDLKNEDEFFIQETTSY